MAVEPTATYRLQLHSGFGFNEAAAIAEYLASLGISHVYTSPYLQAAEGSTHGYDVVDPSRVNEEIGGEAGFKSFCDAVRAAGLSQMIDIVPNHMNVTDRRNRWWWDVLENGRLSPYADFFEIEWEAPGIPRPDRILLPVLGDHYGRVLESGELALEREGASFTVCHHEQSFPVAPSSLAPLLSSAADAVDSGLLAFLADACMRLNAWREEDAERRGRHKTALFALLGRLFGEEPAVAAALDAEIRLYNDNPDKLDSLLVAQNYRLALWRTAHHELGYRRFFAVSELAGVRVENEQVFNAVHALPIAWVRDGTVNALRVDHVDGLRDPAKYLDRLRDACPGTWIVAEKILEPGETLPPDWPIAGTTGYEFLNLAQGLFIDARAEPFLTDWYAEFTGERVDFPALVRECKRLVLRDLLGSEVRRLAELFARVSERHRRHRDYTVHELREALTEMADCFPVYRSYVRALEGVVSEKDARYIVSARDAALHARPDLDPELFKFLADVLSLKVRGEQEDELAMRFQQLTGPAMAKGVEDTAFYRFNRLVALNEVGGDPSHFGTTIDEFHAACAGEMARRPHALLATSTHDTKRSEDVRARLALLSEMPEEWAQACERWSRHNEPRRADGVPDRNTEYLLYQSLVGAWPVPRERVVAYMEKAAREAKALTSWARPDEEYERRLREFIDALLDDAAFCDDVKRFIAPLVAPGRVNSLAQTLLKLTAPGVPDIYQGCELWDFSFVDPDNRRPVDFEARKELLASLDGATPEYVLEREDTGLPKLWVIRQALRLRRERPAAFGAEGGYAAIHARGAKADHAVAFMRGEDVAVLIPRLVLGIRGGWCDTAISLPAGAWRNVLTGDTVDGGELPVADMLARFPVALLARED